MSCLRPSEIALEFFLTEPIPFCRGNRLLQPSISHLSDQNGILVQAMVLRDNVGEWWPNWRTQFRNCLLFFNEPRKLHCFVQGMILSLRIF